METSTQVLGSEEVAATLGSAAKPIGEVRTKARRHFSIEDKICEKRKTIDLGTQEAIQP